MAMTISCKPCQHDCPGEIACRRGHHREWVMVRRATFWWRPTLQCDDYQAETVGAPTAGDAKTTKSLFDTPGGDQ